MAATITDSILNDVKQAIGIVHSYEEFDPQLMVYINSAFATLHQLGYGPKEGICITGPEDKWSDHIKTNRLNFVRSYLIMKVHRSFDPPTSSIAMDALDKEIAEYEWRITSEIECYGEEDN